MGQIGDAYHGVRTRVNALVVGADVDAVAPAKPEWTVRDLLAHVVGVTADVVQGNLDGVGTDPWTARQVAARRDRTVEELLAEWNEHGPVVESMADQFGRSGTQLLTDASTHEHDIRGALGRPGARDADAVEIAFRYAGDALGHDLDGAGHGALVAITPEASPPSGPASPRSRCGPRASSSCAPRRDDGVRRRSPPTTGMAQR